MIGDAVNKSALGGKCDEVIRTLVVDQEDATCTQ
jgi:hypothetical protein